MFVSRTFFPDKVEQVAASKVEAMPVREASNEQIELQRAA